MTPEPADPITVTLQPMCVEQPPLPEAVDAAPAAPPSTEEVRALDVVFTTRPEDRSAGQAFFGLWAGGMLLHDVLADHLSRPEDEDEDRPAKPHAPEG
jgi:hypothetical protein